MKKNVVVIFGGDSSEHDVSCLSATTVIKNMDTEKYNVILVGITKEGRWLLVDSVKDIEDGSWREGEVKAFISPDTTTRSLVILAEGTYKRSFFFNGISSISPLSNFPKSTASIS